MSLDAIALLRITELTAPEGSAAGDLILLSDAALLRTGASFAAEPHDLALGLRRMLGAALDKHDDARGVFFVPGAALEPARAAGSYEAVLEAIGEAGMWVALVEEGTTARPTMVEALMRSAMDGEEVDPQALQGAMHASLAQMAEAFAADDDDDEILGEGTHPGAQMPFDLGALLADPAMMALAQKMRGLITPQELAREHDDDDDDDDDDAEEPTDGSGTELDGALPMDLQALMSSPAFAEMLKNAQEILANNPEEARKLAERFGVRDDDEDDEDDEADEPETPGSA